MMDEAQPDELYELPADLVVAALDASRALSRSLEEIQGPYLVYRNEVAMTFRDGLNTIKLSSGDIARFLGQLRFLTLDSATPQPREPPRVSFFRKGAKDLLRFVELFYDDIVAIICKGGKKLSSTTNTAIVALASWLAAKFGMPQHIATAMAASILVAILTATKGAFCKMAAEDAKKALAAARTQRRLKAND